MALHLKIIKRDNLFYLTNVNPGADGEQRNAFGNNVFNTYEEADQQRRDQIAHHYKQAKSGAPPQQKRAQ